MLNRRRSSRSSSIVDSDIATKDWYIAWEKECLRRETEFASSLLKPPEKILPADWIQHNVVIPPPQSDMPGPLTFRGREYCIEVVNDFANDDITDNVSCFGAQTAKSTSLMAGVAWSVACDPCSFLWVLPSLELARSFSETRWIPIIEATPALNVLKVASRHKFKKTQQVLAGSLINFVGSNSPANLSSRPCRRVILDEVDKFDVGLNEANALELAELRTKGQSRPQRFKVSTPTLVTGIIWQEFLKGDQRRYRVPCPGCKKWIVLAWNQNYTVFRLTGNEAFACWDKEAKNRNTGTWDLDRVERSAHYLCPHCGFQIRDRHKPSMNSGGEYFATAVGSARFRSRHLPSLYSITPDNGVGRLAVKFLQANKSLLGVQGFVNGDLAEPYISQDTIGDRTEIISAALQAGAEYNKLMSVDCQQTEPFFYGTVRAWSSRDTQGILNFHCNTWDELRQVQVANDVRDAGVVVDSGFGARSDADVYGHCAQYGDWIESMTRRLAVGWVPAKGVSGRKRWNRDGTLFPWNLSQVDPYLGSSEQGRCSISLLHFATDFFKDVLESLRKRQTQVTWGVLAEAASEEYWRHMDAEVRTAELSLGRGHVVHIWKPRAKHWPNHWFDCEVLQVVFAAFHGLIDLAEFSPPQRDENKHDT